MSAEFTREVRFTKGYNNRHKPGGGVHGMRIAFILRGPMGAIQGDVQTGWVPGESMSPRTADLFPTGAGVHLHSAQQLKDWWMGPDKCDVLGGECYGDTGYNVSDKFTDCLKDEGEEAAWKYLESIYDSWFADDEVQS